MIGAPPLLAGGDQLTSAWLVAGVAVTHCGAVGVLGGSGVTDADCADTVPPPVEFVAWTVNV